MCLRMLVIFLLMSFTYVPSSRRSRQIMALYNVPSKGSFSSFSPSWIMLWHFRLPLERSNCSVKVKIPQAILIPYVTQKMQLSIFTSLHTDVPPVFSFTLHIFRALLQHYVSQKIQLSLILRTSVIFFPIFHVANLFSPW